MPLQRASRHQQPLAMCAHLFVWMLHMHCVHAAATRVAPDTHAYTPVQRSACKGSQTAMHPCTQDLIYSSVHGCMRALLAGVPCYTPCETQSQEHHEDTELSVRTVPPRITRKQQQHEYRNTNSNSFHSITWAACAGRQWCINSQHGNLQQSLWQWSHADAMHTNTTSCTSDRV
jgi:hypothetical protein